MAAYFFDSSAVVKLYVKETGTRWVQALLDPSGSNQIGIVTICGAEVVAAITRRVRGHAISAADGTRAIRDFQSDFHNEFDRIEVTATLVGEAMLLAEKHGLRGYDAVQLAGALSVSATARLVGSESILVSSDLELNDAARAEGLLVEDPSSHP